MEYTIPIHGIIGYPENRKDKAKYFTYIEFLAHYNKAKNADTIYLDIDSIGGYCDIADKMINDLLILKSEGKTIASYNSGDVCSAASKLFTLAEKNMRVFYPNKGVFLIHNPWSSLDGDASQHLEAAISLKETEDQYIQWYSDNTENTTDIIEKLMSENEPLKAEEIERFGFATIIQEQVQAFAKLKFEKNMNEDEKILTKIGVLETLLKKITRSHTKAVIVNDVDGNELDFSDLTDVADIAVGVSVTVADGSYTLNDGSILVVVGNKVTEIKPAETAIEDEVITEDTETLKLENETLKQELETLKQELETIKSDMEISATKIDESKTALLSEVTTLKSELIQLKALASNHKPNATADLESETPTKRFGWKKQK